MLFNFKYFSRVYYALGTIFILIMVGSIGFMLIEDYEFYEAFYMTIITVSTVGYGEVIGELSVTGRMFTSFLILTSIGTFAYGVSAITTYFVAGEYKNKFRRVRITRRLNKMKNHVVICGYGRVGKKTARDIEGHGQQFVVMEMDTERLGDSIDDPNLTLIIGDATKDEELIRAGVKNASALITTLPNDADNLYVVLTARELNKKMTIISRASEEESVKKLRIAGADNVIMPDHVGGAHMASLVVTPDVIEFLDQISIQGSGDVNLEEVAFEDLPEDFQNHTIAEIRERNKLGVNIIGFKTTDGDYIINPGPNTKLIPNSKLFVLGNKREINLLNQAFNITPPSA